MLFDLPESLVSLVKAKREGRLNPHDHDQGHPRGLLFYDWGAHNAPSANTLSQVDLIF